MRKKEKIKNLGVSASLREPKKKTDANPALVPKLRFPEFREAPGWTGKPMGEVYSFKGNNSLSRDQLNYQHGSVKNIHYGDIHTKFSTLFDVTKETVPFINPSEQLACFDPENDCVEGDMILADASEDLEDIGKSIEIVRLNGERVVAGQHTILARPNDDNLVVGFGAYLFKSRRVRTQIQKESQGSKVLGISATRLANIELPIPRIPTEQRKIAACLSSLDELIAAQARIVDVLKSHKKGLMQQLFPRDGETQPRLRFPEFQNAGEWEEEKLDDVFHLQDGFSFKSTDFVKSKDDATQVIRITDINNRNTNEDKVYVPNAFLKVNNLEKYYVENSDLLLSLTGAAGFNFFFWDGGRAVINQRTSKVTPKKKMSSAMARLLEPLVHEKINVRGEGQNNNLSKEFLSSIILLIPEPAEQQRIADCLTSLDVLIASQTQKLEALKTHKKGLMQQLFPAAEEVGA